MTRPMSLKGWLRRWPTLEAAPWDPASVLAQGFVRFPAAQWRHHYVKGRSALGWVAHGLRRWRSAAHEPLTSDQTAWATWLIRQGADVHARLCHHSNPFAWESWAELSWARQDFGHLRTLEGIGVNLWPPHASTPGLWNVAPSLDAAWIERALCAKWAGPAAQRWVEHLANVQSPLLAHAVVAQVNERLRALGVWELSAAMAPALLLLALRTRQEHWIEALAQVMTQHVPCERWGEAMWSLGVAHEVLRKSKLEWLRGALEARVQPEHRARWIPQIPASAWSGWIVPEEIASACLLSGKRAADREDQLGLCSRSPTAQEWGGIEALLAWNVAWGLPRRPKTSTGMPWEHWIVRLAGCSLSRDYGPERAAVEQQAWTSLTTLLRAGVRPTRQCALGERARKRLLGPSLKGQDVRLLPTSSSVHALLTGASSALPWELREWPARYRIWCRENALDKQLPAATTPLRPRF